MKLLCIIMGSIAAMMGACILSVVLVVVAIAMRPSTDELGFRHVRAATAARENPTAANKLKAKQARKRLVDRTWQETYGGRP